MKRQSWFRWFDRSLLLVTVVLCVMLRPSDIAVVMYTPGCESMKIRVLPGAPMEFDLNT